MGKIRTRVIGDEEVEKQQKDEQKKRSEQKKKERKLNLSDLKDAKDDVVVEESQKEVEKDEKHEVKVRSHGKRYSESKKLVEKKKKYHLEEAVALLKKMKRAQFEESVEVHLNVDKEGLKGEVELPHSTGKTVRVAVVDDALLDKLENGVIDFDVLVTHPSFMPKLAKYARILGPKGLMPNPKAGTISTDTDAVVKKFSKGVLRWKGEAKFPLVHQLVGKISLEDAALAENVRAFYNAVGKVHVKSMVIKSTMSPSVLIDIDTI
ncbi:hypothetical protein HGB07_01620 [Candidatus Roizmanbacteria bacterium]|nr:hypothetical protein [Candidatus Roizmanbacteria bacterium]